MCGKSSTRYLCVLFSVLRVLVQFEVDLFVCCVWDENQLFLSQDRLVPQKKSDVG